MHLTSKVCSCLLRCTCGSRSAPHPRVGARLAALLCLLCDAGSGEEVELDMDEYMQVITSRDDEDGDDSGAGYSNAEDDNGGNGTAA